LNKSSWTGDSGWSSNLEVERGANNSIVNKHLAKWYIGPRTFFFKLLSGNYRSVEVNASKHRVIIGKYRVIQKSRNPYDNICICLTTVWLFCENLSYNRLQFSASLRMLMLFRNILQSLTPVA
jgi:hypothetical protein